MVLKDHTIESDYYLGTRVDRLNTGQALEKVSGLIQHANGTMNPVYFVNVHSIFLALQDPKLMEQLNYASLTLADGSGLNLAGKLLGTPIVENLNGTDFTPKVLEVAEREGWSVFMLGAKDHVIKSARRNILQAYPKLNIAGYRNGYFNKEQEQEVIDMINEARPDILLAGLGSPMQERFIWENRDKLNVKVGFAIGGLFDFLSEEFERAPLWMRKLGLEWVYRFVNDPGSKWKRIFIEIPFFLPLVVMAQLIPKKIK